MRRRYRGDDSDLYDFLSGLVGLTIIGSFGLYFADHVLFYEAIAGLCALILLLTIAAILWGRHQGNKWDKKYQDIKKRYGFELNNFIDQFGRAKGKEAAFTYQQYAFTREHLEYIYDDLEKQGLAVSKKDFYRILRRFIDERERDFTLKSIHSRAAGRFHDLDGDKFEALIKRLYEGAGYTAQLTGRTGDQGGDLVVVRADTKKVIQAKLRRNMTVGNDAVQQVIAAKGVYNCPGAVVITNSTFTPEGRGTRAYPWRRTCRWQALTFAVAPGVRRELGVTTRAWRGRKAGDGRVFGYHLKTKRLFFPATQPIVRNSGFSSLGLLSRWTWVRGFFFRDKIASEDELDQLMRPDDCFPTCECSDSLSLLLARNGRARRAFPAAFLRARRVWLRRARAGRSVE